MRTSTTAVDIIVDPAKAGPVEMHIYTLSPGGGNVYAFNITAEISLPSKGIAPLTVPRGTLQTLARDPSGFPRGAPRPMGRRLPRGARRVPSTP